MKAKKRKRNTVLCLNHKGYPRIWAGPLRGQYLHRVIAAAMLGRPLRKDEQVDHDDGNKLNFWFKNLVIRGEKDHGWKSAKQAYFMKMKDGKLKEEFDKFLEEQRNGQHEEIYKSRAVAVGSAR